MRERNSRLASSWFTPKETVGKSADGLLRRGCHSGGRRRTTSGKKRKHGTDPEKLRIVLAGKSGDRQDHPLPWSWRRGRTSTASAARRRLVLPARFRCARRGQRLGPGRSASRTRRPSPQQLPGARRNPNTEQVALYASQLPPQTCLLCRQTIRARYVAFSAIPSCFPLIHERTDERPAKSLKTKRMAAPLRQTVSRSLNAELDRAAGTLGGVCWQGNLASADAKEGSCHQDNPSRRPQTPDSGTRRGGMNSRCVRFSALAPARSRRRHRTSHGRAIQ